MNSKSQELGENLQVFVRHINSLRQTLPFTAALIQHVTNDVITKLTEFEEANCEVKIDGDNRMVTIPHEFRNEWARLHSKFDKMSLSNKLFPKSIFVASISQYDAFLGRLLREIFVKKQELLNKCEKQFTFNQIIQFSTIKDVIDHLIEKEVESVMRESHEEQFKWMESRFSIELRKDLSIWPDFVEMTERRNLFVHTDGIISSQYLVACKSAGCKLEESSSQGQVLDINHNYFKSSCMILLELGIKLTHVLWRKLFPTEIKVADDSFNETCVTLIEQEDYALACNVLDFACKYFHKTSDEWHKLCFIVNRAQAYKWNGNSDKCNQILNEIDWSAKGDDFILSNAVLTDNWVKAFEIMRRIGNNGSVNMAAYRCWPLFSKIRETEEFQQCFEAIFGQPFAVSTRPVIEKPEASGPDEGEAEAV